MIGRRFFSGRAFFAAATSLVLAKEALGSMAINKCGPPPTPDYPGRDAGLAGQVLQAVVKPAGLDKYYAAQSAIHASKRYMNQLKEGQRYGRLDLNIDCLKSVSTQHKYRMHLDAALSRQKETETFFEKLQDTFGVREYFTKVQERNGAQPAESNGSGF